MNQESKEKIKILKNGPYQVKGNIPLNQLRYKMEPGKGMEFQEEKKYEVGETYFLCRCGRTKNYPYCDGSHAQEPTFDGTEIATQTGEGEVVEEGATKEASLLITAVGNIHGPVLVKGGIPVEGANGSFYPLRNTASLCTCGKSKNKPFCDGSHLK